MRSQQGAQRVMWVRIIALVLSLLTAAPAGALPGSAPDTTDSIKDDVNAVERPILAQPSGQTTTARRAEVSASYGQLPLYFEANRGQTDAAVKFLSRGPGHTLFLTATEAVLVLTKVEPPAPGARPVPTLRPEDRGKVTRSALRTSFVGANRDPRLEAQAELPGKANYFIGKDPGKWRTGVPTYARVRYHDLYPGIDLVYYGNHRQLEYDFVVAPGADPKAIILAFRGADRLEVDAQGDLVLHTPAGELRHRKPVIYQVVDGVRREIAGGYVLKGAHQVGVQVAAYDESRPLVVDPVLFYSTYLGGSGDEGPGHLGGIAVDAAGNAYVTGPTTSTDFPTTSGAFQTAFGGVNDAFVTKLNPTGSGLVYSTYLGGSGFDSGRAIAVDSAGNAYVAGITRSTNFPTTSGAFQTANAGGVDGFVTKLDPTGSTLVYSTYLGGAGDEVPQGISVDATGNAYVAGVTLSTNFPTTAGAYQTFRRGVSDAFATKVNTTGSALVYSTYLGGNNDDTGHQIAVDSAGNAYVVGVTRSTDFPTTLGAFQTTLGGVFDGFVTKLNPTGSGLVYSTFLGGGGEEQIVSVAVDALGNAYVSGYTTSTDFPTTLGAFQTSFGGGTADAIVTKLDPTGSALVYSAYLGGSGDEFGLGIATDAAGNAYVTGRTSSTNFPTVNPIQPTLAGSFDALVTKVNPTGSGLVYSTYLGGGAEDWGVGIAVDTLPSPNAYVTGITASTNFPTTTGAFQTTSAGGAFDAFVAKITDIVLPPPPTVGKVTGGGSIDVTDGIGTFGFIVQRQTTDGPVEGQLQYVNHASGDKVHSESFTSLVITGNMATFSGACTIRSDGIATPCTFTVDVTDNGEPGTTDTFVISVVPGSTEGGTLTGGNIQIHE